MSFKPLVRVEIRIVGFDIVLKLLDKKIGREG